VTVVASGSEVARAADKDPRKAAIKLVSQGDRLFKKGDYAGALARYQEAYQIFPSPKIFYAMAKAEAELGRTLDALAHYEQFIDEAGDEVNEELRVDAQVSVQELEKTLAVVRFDVRPDGVTVAVDGAEVGVSPVDKPVRLAPGEHVYHFEKSGWTSVDKRARLAAGDRLDEQITLREDRPAPVAGEEPPAAPPAATRRRGSDRVIFWTGVGVTTALATGWALAGLAALRNHDEYADTQLSLDERAGARDRGKTWALTSDLLLVGTLAAATFTTWWYLDSETGSDGGEASASAGPRGRARLVPYLDASGGGLAVTGKW
jgi:tetratricopeptide (TPR) repeat protein